MATTLRMQGQNGSPKATKAAKTRDEEFREAAERVYRLYGSDLSAFYRDAQRELTKRDESED
jgi:hypothetical protein